MEYPLIVRSYRLIEDSGGAGMYRGGLGLERIIEPVDHSCTFNGAGERFTQKPWGLFRGGYGQSGEFLKSNSLGKLERLPSKPIGINVKEKEAIIIRTPGAGGYGSARKRRKSAISEDFKSGKFSITFLKQNYPHWKTN